jgi:hypothetical protein
LLALRTTFQPGQRTRADEAETRLKPASADRAILTRVSVVENSARTTRLGGVTGAGFRPGVSGNPGGRPRGLASRVRELVGDDGNAIAEFMFSVMVDERVRNADRIDAGTWLADRAFGKSVLAVDIDVAQHSYLNLRALSNDDLETLLEIARRHEIDPAEIVAVGELAVG